jgi:hypothetical protein
MHLVWLQSFRVDALGIIYLLQQLSPERVHLFGNFIFV